MARFFWFGLALSLLAGGLLACTDSQPTPPAGLILPTPSATIDWPQPCLRQPPSAAQVWPPPYPTPMPRQPVSRSANGYTITIYPLYADASRAVISYTVAGPPQPPPAAVWLGCAFLNDWTFQGPQAHAISRNADLPAWSRLPGWVTPDQTPLPSDPNATHIWAFDTSSLERLPPVLGLQLTGDLFANLPPTMGGPSPTLQEQRLATALDFEIALPVDPRRRLAVVHQSVTAGGETVTLEKVQVAASETDLYLHISPPPQEPTAPLNPPSVELQIGQWHGRQEDERLYPQQGLGGYEVDQGNWVALYPDALLDRQGEWTVTIPTLRWKRYDVAGGNEGPWVFHFQMPAPTNVPAGP